MISVYANPAELEKLAKEKYAVPEFLMMENAAKAMADFIISKNPGKTVIVCGKGNNGGDGYAIARLLQDKCEITVICMELPAAKEAEVQYEMCKRLGIKIISFSDCIKKNFKLAEEIFSYSSVIVDCIYGTGFHGELPSDVQKILEAMNASTALKIACDIPSGLAFNADYTFTMGSQKLALYSDKAKSVCGKIIKIEIGFSSKSFEAAGKNLPDANLITEDDIKLPLRKNRAAHKGTYGHTAVMCGDKAGAAILAATAAMNFGSGLTSLVKSEFSNLEQFKISPSLMISETIPAKTTCVLLGSGFSDFPEAAAKTLLEWFKKSSKPAAVLDAGILTSPKFPDFLKELNSNEDARIILTPHLSELSRFLENVLQKYPENEFVSKNDISISSLAEKPECKISAGRFLNLLFPKTTVIMKSANTFIADEGKTYIISDGAQSLAKGGSGDVLAGLSASLLAQGYGAKDTAITAAEFHALASIKIGAESFDLTPEKLIEAIFD